jgi:hypothetical protein
LSQTRHEASGSFDGSSTQRVDSRLEGIFRLKTEATRL